MASKSKRRTPKPAAQAEPAGKPKGAGLPWEEVSLATLGQDEAELARVAQALGIRDPVVAATVARQIQHVTPAAGYFGIDRMNTLLSLVAELGPKDVAQGMLFTQAAAMHFTALECAGNLRKVLTYDQRHAELKAFRNLALATASLLESGKGINKDSRQRIEVHHQHVTVNDGGQAIVTGDLETGGKTNATQNQPHAPGRADEPGPPLLGPLEALGPTLSFPGSQGLDGVPAPRSALRRTKR